LEGVLDDPYRHSPLRAGVGSQLATRVNPSAQPGCSRAGRCMA
jgi:hypothetical protein